MDHQIFIIAPHTTDGAGLKAMFEATGAPSMVAAVLIARGPLEEPAYRQHAETLVPAIQEHGAAALLDNAPDLVRALGADGVHVTTGLKALTAAIASLKPDFVVGTGDIGSRHEAMVRGETEVDYLLFGDRAEDDGYEMASWWSETFEVPSVWLSADPADPRNETIGTEFVGRHAAASPEGSGQ
ncbi:thiamine phosphate synthase [Pelagibacterium montanilacus]|uniref:thiamine phosphate synthase n=1 Tax=Pelagibacterium montanilacus TaxID=2185280 RepID=UPI000F8D5C8B|nr:thiamine phosphate synthase [Pelagibacterium montanilacus]